MSLEAGGFVNDLDATNPPGGDTKSQGDDHLRLIKTALKATFKGAVKEFQFPSSANFTANGALLKTHQNNLVTVSTAAGAVSLTLPALVANDAGWSTFVRKTTTDVNAVTLTGTIDGVTNLVFNQINMTVMLIWNGTAWFAIQFPTLVFPDAATGIELVSKDPGANIGPVLSLFRDSASPSPNDIIGTIDLYGRDSAGNKQQYGRIASVIDDATTLTEDGSMFLQIVVAGTIVSRIVMTGAGADVSGNLTATGSQSAATIAGAQIGTQPENETGTALDKVPVIGRQHFNPRHPKAWCNFNGTGVPAVTVGTGVSSITDSGVGEYVLNWTTAFSTANYCVVPGGSTSAGGGAALISLDRAGTALAAPTASAQTVQSYGYSGGALADIARNYIAVFGDFP